MHDIPKWEGNMKIAPTFLCSLGLLAGMSGLAKAQQSPIEQVAAIANRSQCVPVHWKDRGLAPKAYIRGMAIVFARAVCHPDRADVKVVSSARGAADSDAGEADALTLYDKKFSGLKMSNAVDGIDSLRHAYTLLIGLGMRESSGQYCVGRDQSADFSSADSAEAGLFQTSWGAHTKHATLPVLYEGYKADQKACLLDVFSKNVSCTKWDARTWGTGDGADWQQLTKACPAFATEYAAVLIRTHGGKKGEFGPLRTQRAEVIPACDAMLSEVQHLVQSDPGMCSGL